jgi:hypothetical protein
MKRKPFAGIYRCSCGYLGAYYFFDSKPVETSCGRCDGTAKFFREIAERDATKARESKRAKVAA